MAAASAGEYGYLPITGGRCICADEGLVSRQASRARVQHGQPLQHFFDNVFRMVDELFHDVANLQRLPLRRRRPEGISLGQLW
jgi:hypothetical protein